MSKLIDKLNQMTKSTPQPLGFHTARTNSVKPKLLLIATLPQSENADQLAEVVSGTDAVVITKMSSGSKALPKITQTLSDIPWGLRLEDIGKRDLKAVIEAGCDFLVFPTDASVLALPKNENKVGRILQVGLSLNEGLVRTVNDLPVDAVLIADEPKEGTFLTWHHLMLVQRFASILAKPLLLSIPQNLGESELQLLWEVGVDGVVAEASEKLSELRQAINKLTAPTRRRRKAEALVPLVREDISTTPEEEEEEEEE